MKKKVISELSSYLNASPSQVRAWDAKVINHFVDNPAVFSQFQNGCHYRKWDIYHAIRYGR